MALLSNAPGATIGGSAVDTGAAELSQLLLQLQRTVLYADGDRERRLRTSEFERARVAANLEYARSSLTKLEHDALGIKAPGRRTEVQGDLNRKRELLELLLDRLEDFREMALHDDGDDDSSEGEDLLGYIIPTPSDSMADSTSTNIATEGSSHDGSDEQTEAPEMAPPPRPPAAEPEPRPKQPVPAPTPQTGAPLPSSSAQPEPTQTTQELRPRGGGGGAPSPSDASHSTARAALFASRRKTASPLTTTATAEAILENQRAEQDALSDSILKMAGALKNSSQRFSSTLEADKQVLARAGEGMEKTENSMEAARGRMGTLRKMTEGKSWWGRMMLYAWVYGLMVGLVLLVFAMPKLRF